MSTRPQAPDSRDRGGPARPGEVEDYTAAALCSLFVLALMALMAIWAAAGFLAALGVGALAERGLAGLDRA